MSFMKQLQLTHGYISSFSSFLLFFATEKRLVGLLTFASIYLFIYYHKVVRKVHVKIIESQKKHQYVNNHCNKSDTSKAALTPGNMLPCNMLPSACCFAANKIVASLLPVCCCRQRDTCCRDTGNMLLPETSCI